MSAQLGIAPGAFESKRVGAGRIFDDGDVGTAHVLAHQFADAGLMELGHRELGSWLAQNEGTGSDFVHLHFHMAVFELALGMWEEARERFERHVLPVACQSDDALTDAPALLWRLACDAPESVAHLWEPLRQRALGRRGRERNVHVELHHLLALAGARDVTSLDAWLADLRGSVSMDERRLYRVGRGLLSFAAGRHRQAAELLEDSADDAARLGGSSVQNTLFEEIQQACLARAVEPFSPPSSRAA